MTPEKVEQIRAAVVFLMTSSVGLAQILLTDALPPEAWGAIDTVLGAVIVLVFLIFKQDTVQRAIDVKEAQIKNQERFGPENGD